jgi:uncharacterized C2H2 Zn-finger protein
MTIATDTEQTQDPDPLSRYFDYHTQNGKPIQSKELHHAHPTSQEHAANYPYLTQAAPAPISPAMQDFEQSFFIPASIHSHSDSEHSGEDQSPYLQDDPSIPTAANDLAKNDPEADRLPDFPLPEALQTITKIQIDPQNPCGDPITTVYYVCPWSGCGRQFTRYFNLRSHYRIHSGGKPFVCPVCDLSFARNHDLRRHSRIHSGQRPYQCPHCFKSFSRNDAMSRHVRLASCLNLLNSQEPQESLPLNLMPEEMDPSPSSQPPNAAPISRIQPYHPILPVHQRPLIMPMQAPVQIQMSVPARGVMQRPAPQETGNISLPIELAAPMVPNNVVPVSWGYVSHPQITVLHPVYPGDGFSPQAMQQLPWTAAPQAAYQAPAVLSPQQILANSRPQMLHPASEVQMGNGYPQGQPLQILMQQPQFMMSPQ